MLYINDPQTKSKARTYDQLVQLAISAGIDPKRAYLYLAALGVHGELGRVIGDNGAAYERPVKLAVTTEGYFVTKVETCENCGGLKIN